MRIGAPLNSEATPILQWIEVATSLQIPSFQIIGLPAPEVAEARERIRAAIEASELKFPRRRVVLNLSPASIRKRGTGLDLAMALAVLLAAEKSVPKNSPQMVVAWGELGLDGTVKPAGQLTRALYAAWKEGASIFLVADTEYRAACERLMWIKESGEFSGPLPRIIPVTTLTQAWNALFRPEIGATLASGIETETSDKKVEHSESHTALLPLPLMLERTICIAALGCHHLLLLGPRGTGKSHALEWLIALQPPVSALTKVQNALIAEMTTHHTIPSFTVPIRRISVNARPAALIGNTKPGEFSLAHGGLLVADEILEWAGDTREALREPLERGLVSLTRVSGSFELPARFTLAANGNLCPCGGWPPQFPMPQIPEEGSQGKPPPRCRCQVSRRKNYIARLSGPILDRLDLLALVTNPPKLPKAKSKNFNQLRSVNALRARVILARERAIKYWGSPPGHLSATQIEDLLVQHPQWNIYLDLFQCPSLRARHKMVRLAISLACWDGLDQPGEGQFAEAACYRPERLGLEY